MFIFLLFYINFNIRLLYMQSKILPSQLKNLNKFYKLLLTIIIFSFILMLFPNDEFTGLIDIEKELKGEKSLDKNIETNNIHYTIINLFDRFYFSLITAIGIGYGDIVPKSTRLKILNALFIMTIVYFTLE